MYDYEYIAYLWRSGCVYVMNYLIAGREVVV